MSSPILQTLPLGFPWPTVDPFLFCVHHDDRYPAGNEGMGPAASLEGRQLGMDFEGKDGWRMYHGREVPGFPQHPHRGFETVTILRSGYIDHSDSLGATARFGPGDVQWLTAGGGIVHCEMFPLLERERPNPVELFQIWLNLPGEDKMADPHFTMLWRESIPRRTITDEAGRTTEVQVIAGRLEELEPPGPPPRSWAAKKDNDVAIWSIVMQPGARWTLPAASGEEVLRTLYFFRGSSLHIAGELKTAHAGFVLPGELSVELQAGDEACEVLVLQGRPIGQPVVAHGPFVMNSREQIQRAMQDYQRTRFGGWPHPHDAPVHPRDEPRFAIHADGKSERHPR